MRYDHFFPNDIMNHIPHILLISVGMMRYDIPIQISVHAIPQEQMEMIWEALEYVKEYEVFRTEPDDSINSALVIFGRIQMGAMTPPSRKSCYNFRVTEINRVVDGDTIDVTIDLGFDLYKKERVPLQELIADGQEIRKRRHWE